MSESEENIEPALPRQIIIQRQIVVTAALVAVALMLREILDLVWRAQDPQFGGITVERWLSIVFFAGLGYLVWLGIEKPSWVKVVWIVIATIYFTVWSCWALIAKPAPEAPRPKAQLSVPPRQAPVSEKLKRENFAPR